MAQSVRTLLQFLTVYAVADLLACTPGAVRKWIRQGRLKAVRASRLVRIRVTDLEAFLKEDKE